MYQLCTDTICSKPFYYGFLWLLMSFFLSYEAEQLVGIQQGIHKRKSELSLSTAGNLPLQPPDPIYVSRRGWQNQLFFFPQWCNFLNKKNHSNLHLFNTVLMDFFHSWIVNKSTDVSVSVWVLWAAYTAFVCSIHAFKNREAESATPTSL